MVWAHLCLVSTYRLIPFFKEIVARLLEQKGPKSDEKLKLMRFIKINYVSHYAQYNIKNEIKQGVVSFLLYTTNPASPMDWRGSRFMLSGNSLLNNSGYLRSIVKLEEGRVLTWKPLISVITLPSSQRKFVPPSNWATK